MSQEYQQVAAASPSPPTISPPVLPPVLSDEQLNLMHHRALRLLATLGFEVDNAGLRDRLLAFDGIFPKHGRLCLAPWLVERQISLRGLPVRPLPPVAPSAGRIQIVASMANHVVDLDTAAIRPQLWADAVAVRQLIDAMHVDGVHGRNVGSPQDVPPELWPLAEYVISSEHGREGGSTIAPSSGAVLDYLREACAVMGDGFPAHLYVNSPLDLSGYAVDVLWDSIHRGFARNIDLYVSAMPIIGQNAPVRILDAFTQAIAEVLGGYTVLSLLTGQTNIRLQFMAFAADMRRGHLVVGTPEQNVCDQVGFAVNRFYGVANPSTRSLRSMAKRPGAHSCLEKAGSAVNGSLLGSRTFTYGGLLSMEEVFSAEQLVLDREIADWAGRLVQPSTLSPESEFVAVMAEGIARGNFLASDQTLDHWRETYWTPSLLTYELLGQWRQAGEPELQQMARERARQYLRSYDFELEAGKRRELHRIWDTACERLGLGRLRGKWAEGPENRQPA